MKIVCIVLSLLLGSFVAMAQSGEKNFIDQNYIEVSGTAEMEIVPDQIYLKIVISEKDKRQENGGTTGKSDDYDITEVGYRRP